MNKIKNNFMSKRNTNSHFEPISGRILIVGSKATAKSLSCGFYYTGSSNNVFWEMLDYALFEGESKFLSLVNRFKAEKDNESLSEIKKLLEDKNIGLGDIVLESDNNSSKDSDIRNPKLNMNLLNQIKNARVVLCNGSKAYRLVKKLLRENSTDANVLKMPSTSSTPGKFVLSKEEKLNKWKNEISNYIRK